MNNTNFQIYKPASKLFIELLSFAITEAIKLVVQALYGTQLRWLLSLMTYIDIINITVGETVL